MVPETFFIKETVISSANIRTVFEVHKYLSIKSQIFVYKGNWWALYEMGYVVYRDENEQGQ